MKRLLGWVLAIALLLTPVAAYAGEIEGLMAEDAAVVQSRQTALPVPKMVQDSIGLQAGTELVVGATTQMSGSFATDLFGMNTADLDVRALLHGYTTIVWSTLGATLNGVAVVNLISTANSDGSRTYTFEIAKNLTYNNGQAITAKDYVFSLLLSGAPEIEELGGAPRGMDFLVGYGAYRSGQSEKIQGVRLLSDYSFSMQVSSSYMPYFYGLAVLGVTPYPVEVIAPGCTVADDGDGAYMTASGSATSVAGPSGSIPAGAFTADLLRQTLLDPTNGYVYNPRITSGPYQLTSFNKDAHEARFTVNTNYLGNFEGQRPHIEKLVFKQLQNETMVSQFQSGSVGLVNKITNIDAFNAAHDLVTLEGVGRLSDYPRAGFAFLSFACDQQPTSSVAVRNAIARCIDKAELLEQTIGRDRGLVVHGYYGLGQWMMTTVVQTDAGEINAATAVEQFAVTMDLEAAKQLLIDDGWTLNQEGQPFTEGANEVRCKEINGAIVPLMIKWAKSSGNEVADALEERLQYAFGQVGIGLEVTVMPFSNLLRKYYTADKTEYNMFYLASNFTYLFDPYYEFNTAEEYMGLVNATGLRDEQLMNLASDMRHTDPQDAAGYITKWMAFQTRWVQVMPMVPLYSNVYSDLYVDDLQGYEIGVHSSWASAIPYAYISDVPLALPPSADEELSFEDTELDVAG